MPISLIQIACTAAAALVVPAAVGLSGWTTNATVLPAETVVIAPGAFSLPRPGEFLEAGRPTAAPVDRVVFDRSFAIMKHQVSLAEYRRCVDDGACEPADAVPKADAEALPVTGVSYLDAEAYAAWYSEVTGETWRLPTDAEWAFAAGERFGGETYTAVADDPANPALAWIRRYQEEAATRRQPDPLPKPKGFYGPNANGVFDMAGNVWEWTSTCYVRATLAGEGTVEAVENCGVHVAEGRHRAYMSNFLRDGRSGGCAFGSPTDNLGFRLVRESQTPVLSRLWRDFGPAG